MSKPTSAEVVKVLRGEIECYEFQRDSHAEYVEPKKAAALVADDEYVIACLRAAIEALLVGEDAR